MDFLNCPHQAYSVSINSIHWPNLFYGELFSMIDNSASRQNSFDFVWEDEVQLAIDRDMTSKINELNQKYKSC